MSLGEGGEVMEGGGGGGGIREVLERGVIREVLEGG